MTTKLLELREEDEDSEGEEEEISEANYKNTMDKL